MTQTLGRLAPSQVGQPVIYDAPERTVQAILTQQDAIITAIQALCTKLDGESVGDGTLAASIGATLQPIQLIE